MTNRDSYIHTTNFTLFWTAKLWRGCCIRFLSLLKTSREDIPTIRREDIPTIRPDEDSEDQLTGSTTHRPYQRPRDTHLHLFPSHPLQAAYLLLTPLHQRQVATG